MNQVRLRAALSAVLITAVLLTGGLLTGIAAGLPGRAAWAAPEPVDVATAQAAALRLQVDDLRRQAARAIEAYDGAYDRLGATVTQHLTAQAALDRALAESGTAQRAGARRVRALYIAGGLPALYATALQGADLADVHSRLQAVRTIVGGDRRLARTADQTVLARVTAERGLAAAAAAQTAVQREVAHRADAVRALLGRTDAVLAAADARVAQLAEQQRQAVAAAAAAEAAGQLSALQLPQVTLFGAAAASDSASLAIARLAIATATRHLGKPYLWGGNGPDRFDCSGLTVDAYRAAGIRLPRTASQQWSAGPHVPLADLTPGDLLFWADDLTDPRTIHHVAIFLGGNKMLAAPHTGAFVRIQPVYFTGYLGAMRPSAIGPS